MTQKKLKERIEDILSDLSTEENGYCGQRWFEVTGKDEVTERLIELFNKQENVALFFLAKDLPEDVYNAMLRENLLSRNTIVKHYVNSFYNECVESYPDDKSLPNPEEVDRTIDNYFTEQCGKQPNEEFIILIECW